jgi:hypothetical protein
VEQRERYASLYTKPGAGDVSLIPAAREKTSKLKDAPPPYEEEVLGLMTYTSNAYHEINGYLRGIQTFSPEYTEIIETHTKMAVAALDALPDYNGTVYRGGTISNDIIDKYKEGEIVTEKGFTSTSVASDIASGFQDKQLKKSVPNLGFVSYVIKSKTGKLVEDLSIFDEEKEVLFKPETKFKVLSKKSVDGVTTIYMEEV